MVPAPISSSVLFDVKSNLDFIYGAQKKRRVRSFKSCLTCRQKKIKCDQLKPSCTGCLKRGRAHLCHYEDQAWSVNVLNETLDDILPEAKERYEQAHKQHEAIDFYSSTFPCPISCSQGPLTWLSLLKKDKYTNVVALNQKTKSALMKRQTNYDSKREEKFLKKWNREFVDVSVDKISTRSSSENLVNAISKYFKDTRLVWLLLDRFFNTELYVALPYIDKNEFLQQISKLIGPRNNICELNLRKTIDLAIIGIALIMMRFSSSSTFDFRRSNDPFIEVSPDLEYMRKNLIPYEVTQILSEIQTELLLMKSPRIEIYQFLSMKNEVDLFSPEDSDCLKASNQSGLGNLIQYGMQCSLNRDPVNRVMNSNSQVYGGYANASKNKNLLRRLWFQAVNLDFIGYSWIGYPLLINPEFYDTNLPTVISPGKEGYDSMENILNRSVSDRFELNNVTEEILNMILSMKTKPSLDVFIEKVKSFEEEISKFKKLKDIIASDNTNIQQRYENYKDFMYLMETHSLLQMVQNQIYVFYCHKNDVENSMIYLIKLLKTCETIWEAVLFLDPHNEEYDLERTFGTGIIIYPKIEACVHRAFPILFGLYSRLKYYKLNSLPNTPPFKSSLPLEIIQVLDSMVSKLDLIIRSAISFFLNISDVYFHAWVLAKVQISIIEGQLKTFKGADYYHTWTTEDLNFMKLINRFKDVDFGFDGVPNDPRTRYLLSDFNVIETALDRFAQMTSPPLVPSTDSNKNSDFGELGDLFDLRMDDDLWFDRMLQEYSSHETLVFLVDESFPKAF